MIEPADEARLPADNTHLPADGSGPPDEGDRVPGYPRPHVRWPVLVAFGAWSTFVWTTRIRNIWGDVLLSTNEKAALTVVALVFVGLGIGVFFVGISLRRWFPTRTDVVAVGVLGGWTLGVWASRVFDIAFGGDHEAPFIVVHTLLAVISVALAAWSWTVIADAKAQSPDERRDPEPLSTPTADIAGSPLAGSVPVEGQQ